MGTDVPVLQVRDLSTHYGNNGRLFRAARPIRAVEKVSFDIRAGETLGLVGESGCGKTTLVRTLLRLLPATEGTVSLMGQDLISARGSALRRLRREIQVVFQDPYQSLNPRLTIAEIIAEPWHMHDVIDRSTWTQRVEELLESVGLRPEYASRYPHEFSGGQRQRIGIARALALNPKVLVCDEPVSALDVSVQAQVVNLLMEIQRKTDIAILFVAHDLSIVRHIADRVAVMYLGQIVEQGAADAVLGSPTHPYTQALVSAVPIDDPRLRGKFPRIVLKGDPPSPVSPPSGCHFRTRCWRAFDRCSVDEPALIVRDNSDHPAACHIAAPLS